jgi:hypothetical protein
MTSVIGLKSERTVTFDFEKLSVYPQAVDFANQVCGRAERFQRGYGFLVDQLSLAALSVRSCVFRDRCISFGNQTVDRFIRRSDLERSHPNPRVL